MNVWILFLVGLNFALVAAVAVLWLRVNRPQKDDPRLSKGLQLLQSKIAVLEDLSDRSESQVHQLVKILDAKIREVQHQLLRSDEKLNEIDRSMKKSIEVAEIFEDKIPHEEIIERQTSKKILRAAQLANQGVSVEEIGQQVELSAGEIEFISKLNRDKMLIEPDQVPDWAKSETSMDLDKAFSEMKGASESVDKIKAEFEQACRDHETEQKNLEDKYRKFSNIEPQKFRQQVQSFVDNILGPEKEEKKGLNWVDEGPEETPTKDEENLSANPPTRVENTASQEVEDSSEREDHGFSMKPIGPPVVENPVSFEKAAESPDIEEPSLGIKASNPDSVLGQLTADLLKKAQETEDSQKTSVIRADDSAEVKKVKFPRLDITDNLS